MITYKIYLAPYVKRLFYIIASYYCTKVGEMLTFYCKIGRRSIRTQMQTSNNSFNNLYPGTIRHHINLKEFYSLVIDLDDYGKVHLLPRLHLRYHTEYVCKS